ncbi:MAG TPA: hypothetical protein VFM14_17570 [Gemmatimonadales bacterium]|nr:hypothetical protein [Gemmatimonadales bacterium]
MTAGAQVRYAAAQFDSAVFRHITQSEIQTIVGGRQRRERITVAGLLTILGLPAQGDTLQLEAWFDSLEVRRSNRDGSLKPDTDGMIGGRYRGSLTSDGRYLSTARPFVPDGVAEVVDLSRLLEDLLPRLPRRALPVGAVWRDPGGLVIRRLSDNGSGDALLRFRAALVRRVDSVRATGDTASIPAKQTSREEETFAWDATWGLVRRERHIVVDTEIPGGSTVGRPVRSRVEQRVTLERLAAH